MFPWIIPFFHPKDTSMKLINCIILCSLFGPFLGNLYVNVAICNGNRTEWSTIQGVIASNFEIG